MSKEEKVMNFNSSNNNNEQIILEVIPIYVDKMYPSKDEIWTFTNDSLKNGTDRQIVLNFMLQEIEERFGDSDVIIVLEKRKVIRVLEKKDE